MKYKFKKNQLFRKKLEMPERIVNKVYNNTLTYQEFAEYNLEDKVPTSCLIELHRKVVDKFGLEKAKEIDWELIDLKGLELSDTLEDMDANAESINDELYKLVITDMKPKDYTEMMKKKYSASVLTDSDVSESVQNDFNSGYLKINEIVKIWDKVKEKELSLCLKNDYYNKDNVTEEELKKFMDEYDGLLAFVDEPKEIYDLIVYTYRSDRSDEDKKEYFKKIVEKILDKTLDENSLSTVTLTGEQYKIIFKYTSLDAYLYKKLGEEHADKLMKELGKHDSDYLLEIPIPFNVLIEDNVLAVIETYGLDNIVNFDEECGHYFTNNDCEKLRLMYDMYIHNGINEHDKERTIFTRNMYDASGKYVDTPYTKSEFYEAIRRMIVYGPTNDAYDDKMSDYREITGDFRDLNPELFVDNNAPQDFQDAFYNKELTPIFVRDHYNCISYLIGKKLSTIFSPLKVRISKSEDGYYYRYENIYKFLEEKLGFEETIKIITDYADVFDILFSSYEKISQTVFIAPIQFNNSDTLEDIINKINDKLYELIIKANIKYSSNLSKTMKEKYPYVFITNRASKELHDMFYNREINAKYLIAHPEQKRFFEGLDIELFFDYMPIILIDEENNDDTSNRTIENLILFVKKLFGNEEGLKILLAYNTYLDKVNEKFGFNKVEFKSSTTKEEFLVQIDCLIYLNIIRGDILYDENMPTHFKAAYPSLFLTENTPDDIKYKFYNRLFNLNDFYDNPVLLKHFANTDIACCLDTTFSCMIGLFNSNDFLDIIKICGESIKSDTKLFGFLRNKTNDMLTAKTMGELLYEYFKDNEQSLKYLIFLQRLGFINGHITKLSEQFNKLIKVRPELDINNPALNGNLLEDNTIKLYGYDVITSILAYNTGAHKVIIDALRINDDLLPKWITYLKKYPIYDKEILHLAITNYESMKSLINSLVNDNIELDSNQLINLKTILYENNKYLVQDINNLTNYDEYCKHVLDDKYNSGNINVVRDGILEKLFNTSLFDVNKIFSMYGLQSKEFTKEYLLQDNILSVEDEAVIEVIREIYLIDDVEELKARFKEIKELGFIKDSLNVIEGKLKKYYARQIKKVLFKPDTDYEQGISFDTIPGIEDVEFRDINGNYINSDDSIDIVKFEGIPFNLLIYSQPIKYEKYCTYNMLVKENPAMWNKITDKVILTNMISDSHMGCVDHCDKSAVYYGFNEISENSLMIMSRRDVVIENNSVDFEPYSSLSEYMIPSIFQNVSSSYNTIGLNINSSDSSEYNHRIQPNFIVCFDDNISYESKKAAQYFNIPIYIIYRDKYNNKNKEKIDKYKLDEVSALEREDIENILYTRDLDLSERYKLLIKLVDSDYEKKNITESKYKELMEEAEKQLIAFATQNDISVIEISEEENKEE